jgi:hypothetical protein
VAVSERIQRTETDFSVQIAEDSATLLQSVPPFHSSRKDRFRLCCITDTRETPLTPD